MKLTKTEKILILKNILKYTIGLFVLLPISVLALFLISVIAIMELIGGIIIFLIDGTSIVFNWTEELWELLDDYWRPIK